MASILAALAIFLFEIPAFIMLAILFQDRLRRRLRLAPAAAPLSAEAEGVDPAEVAQLAQGLIEVHTLLVEQHAALLKLPATADSPLLGESREGCRRTIILLRKASAMLAQKGNRIGETCLVALKGCQAMAGSLGEVTQQALDEHSRPSA